MSEKRAAFQKIIDQLAVKGFAQDPDFFSPQEITLICDDFEEQLKTGQFRRAKVGKTLHDPDSLAGHRSFRGDEILWFAEDPALLSASQRIIFSRLEAFRAELNENLFLSLVDLEGHYAIYRAGDSYDKHIDRFRNDDRRVVSVVLYFNRKWTKSDGGELAIYPQLPEQSVHPQAIIEPAAGTLICFMSASTPHEVLVSRRDRISFAGWYRRRP